MTKKQNDYIFLASLVERLSGDIEKFSEEIIDFPTQELINLMAIFTSIEKDFEKIKINVSYLKQELNKRSNVSFI